ncbi:squalene/phytoene synthase family protein [Sphingomonas sp. R86521]|uniref:squalene/phytoene synthase family protein n=1 Tax=Sphingomonas sp. R86521 TaxID=3093860 RepID=UPI0036D28D2F
MSLESGSPAQAERALVLFYAPRSAHAGIAALLALDDTLGGIVRSTREPIVGQMRLTWWHEALTKLDTAPPPAEPVLQALAASVVTSVSPGEHGAVLAAMIDGWEVLLEPEIDDAAITTFGRERGGRLFAVMARLCGVEDARIAVAGEGWALADLSRRMSDPAAADRVREHALERLDAALPGAGGGTWPRDARAMGALALLARADLNAATSAAGSPRRIGRILIHRLTGR